jgi:hypothetical protein
MNCIARRIGLLTVVAAGLASCDAPGRNSFTLYRNNPLDLRERVHFATFDSYGDANYNMRNCQMASRLLNASETERRRRMGYEGRFTGYGFWCEPGNFSEQGLVPSSFVEAFPTDA